MPDAVHTIAPCTTPCRTLLPLPLLLLPALVPVACGRATLTQDVADAIAQMHVKRGFCLHHPLTSRPRLLPLLLGQHSHPSMQDVADAIAQMHVKGRYRELLLIVETCQAATLYSKIQ